MTAVWTAEGWLYLTVVLNVYSRLVIGWAMDSHREESLVEAALWMALGRRPKQSIFEWIEVSYNRQRRHSSVAYLSPVAYEQHSSHG